MEALCWLERKITVENKNNLEIIKVEIIQFPCVNH